MSSRSKKRKQEAAQQQHPASGGTDKVTRRTAEVFTCASEIARDFASQCDQRLESLEIDLIYARLAVEMWHGQDERTKELQQALADFAAELQRQEDALVELERRLGPIADDPKRFHIHLDRPEAYHELIRQRTEPRRVVIERP